MKKLLLAGLLAMSFSCVIGVGTTAHAATFNVDRITDEPDDNPGDGICDVTGGAPADCSLRAAIQETNALGGADTINI
ncbi:MAG: CSLREA domain-containing protein, partial [Deltaproteobacteria bacterium]|nr:CSLREA domain-containing protein [Deltaproteobacteria bacterium]